MLSIDFDAAEVIAHFADLPQSIRDALLERMQSLRDLLQDKVIANLSGLVLNAKTGALRASIQSDCVQDDSNIRVSVGSDGSVPYAAIQEFGGKTAPHEILASKAKALAFVMGGARVFFKSVHHPGSVMPERSYLRSALADMQDDIADELNDALQNALEQK